MKVRDSNREPTPLTDMPGLSQKMTGLSQKRKGLSQERQAFHRQAEPLTERHVSHKEAGQANSQKKNENFSPRIGTVPIIFSPLKSGHNGFIEL